MPYQPLELHHNTPAVVRSVIEQTIEAHLRDVHVLFRLPTEEAGLDAGCNFAIAHTLLALVSGVSSTIFAQRGGAGQLFRELLDELYWPFDPPQGVTISEASGTVYEEFRNPFTHALGIASKFNTKTKFRKLLKPTGRKFKVKKSNGLREEDVERLEVSSHRPTDGSTLTVRADATVLFVDALYWGFRRMIERLTADQARMQVAEKHFSILLAP